MPISKEQQEENKEVIRKFHETLTTLDMEKVGELFADDAVMGGPGRKWGHEGKKQIVAWLIDLFAPKKSFKVELIDMRAVGPWVTDERVDWSVLEEGERGLHVAGSYLVENGKIKDWTEWGSSEKPSWR